MSRLASLSMLLICLLAIPSFGQQQTDVFGDDTYDLYAEAFDLNDSRNYLEAYRQILLADKSVCDALSKAGLEASGLSDDSFVYPYWAVKKSKAEIAYMLGIHSDMEAVSRELHTALDRKVWQESSESSAIVEGLWADLLKIDGDRFYLTEQFEQAESALNMSLDKAQFAGNEDFVWKVRGDLAQLFYKQAELSPNTELKNALYRKALAQIDSILAGPLFSDDGSHMQMVSRAEKMDVLSWHAICLARLGLYSDALAEIKSVLTFFKSSGDQRLYAEALRKKAKILMLQYDSTGYYNPEAAKCYKQYLALSRKFIDQNFVHMSESEREQYWMAEQSFVTDCYRLEDKEPALLYDVALYSKAVLLQMGRTFKDDMSERQRKAALASIRVTWQQVRNCLPDTACAVEFIVYDKKGETHIGALVLSKQSSSPTFVEIAKKGDITDFNITSNSTVADVLQNSLNAGMIDKLYVNAELSSLIWPTTLSDAIGSARDVYFAPDGIFHQLAIEYLLPERLQDKNFYRLTTTRILNEPKRQLSKDSMLLCGAVNYNSSVEDSGTDNDALAYSLLAKDKVYWRSLPSSAVEIDSVRTVRHAYSQDHVLCADSVTEQALQNLLAKHRIVLFSTHGNFADVNTVGTDIHPATTDRQLSQSCLILSGANKSLGDSNFDASQHDGILSARELSKMDLSNVDLTILSACMSGLGYISPDGVYGLQRGLKSAGVRAIVATLWNVDDDAASRMVIYLNKNLEAGMSLHQAFMEARQTLQNEKIINRRYGMRRIKSFDNPFYYNAFILIDGI